MKRTLLGIGFVALVAVANLVSAQATCPAGTSPVKSISQLVGGNTMCAARGASERWQEFHQGTNSGSLIDWKNPQGGQPTEQVGTWTARDSAGALIHNYGTGGTYIWAVCSAGTGNTGSNPYTLVGSGGTISGVTVQAGQGACP